MSMHYDAFQFVLLVISLLAVSYVFHKKTSLVYMVSSIMGKKKELLQRQMIPLQSKHR